jgi:hypothetical protein
MTWEGEDRRKSHALDPEDRDRLTRIEVHCENFVKSTEISEARLRRVETKQVRLITSQAGVWAILVVVGGWLGIK